LIQFVEELSARQDLDLRGLLDWQEFLAQLKDLYDRYDDLKDAAVKEAADCLEDLFRADDYAGAGKQRRLAVFLLLGPCHCERARVAQVVPGGLDPAVGRWDVRDAELVDMAVEGIGDAAHMPADANGS
jgi:hypothetical protein